MKKLIAGMLAGALALGGAALANAEEEPPVYGTSDQGIVPTLVSGNFRWDAATCLQLGYTGLEDVGFKVDGFAGGTFGPVVVTVDDNKVLSWEITGAWEMLAVVMKGGNAYNIYDYGRGNGLTSDGGLVSPLNEGGNTPNISHYNLCYGPIDFEEGPGTGCTPGYWRNHLDRWAGYAPGDDFDTVFGVDLFDPDITLGEAVSSPESYGVFAFHAVAALLNSTGGVPNPDGTVVDYPLTTAEVIAMVQAAAATGDFEQVKDDLEAFNEAGCPLSSTSGSGKGKAGR